jgi:DNA-binding response OmpR family regulator
MEQSLKILLIDDDENILTNLCHFLKSKNYDVTPASDGVEGLNLFENHPQGFDLVITDLLIPRLSGAGLISIIKKRFPDIPIIAISGWGEYPGAFALESQADMVLSKPFDLFELDKAIIKLISSKKNKIQD